jgi:hypothetical protein
MFQGGGVVSESHPIWDVYDQLRTVRLNEKYYGVRLQKYERINFWSEIIVALASSSSAIAGFAFWSTTTGSEVWKGLLVISALIATSKPLLNLTKKIKAYEELLLGYRLLCHDLKDLKININQTQSYTVSHQATFKKIIEKQRILAGKSPERTEKNKVKNACQNEVLLEFPANAFYIPE